MPILNYTRPRRLFDSRHDYNSKRGNIADEADRAILLRLVDGVPQQYLILTAAGWRAELTDHERNDDMIKMWYGAIETRVKDEDAMSELRLKADFYRAQWASIPLARRSSQSRNEWITRNLTEHFKEKLDGICRGFFDSFLVPKALWQDYSDFERRQVIDSKFRMAAQRIYLDITQPEAAVLLRKQVVEKLANGESKVAEAALNNAGAGENAFHGADEAYFWDRKREAALMTGKGKGPIVWPWEKGGALAHPKDVDKSAELQEGSDAAAVPTDGRRGLRELLASAVERRMKACNIHGALD